jgi:hypothetical protein
VSLGANRAGDIGHAELTIGPNLESSAFLRLTSAMGP